MLKHVLLASAILITAPALAQNQPQTATPQTDTNAAPAQPQTAPAPAAPTASAPAPQTTSAPTSAAPTTPPAPTTADAQPQTAPAPTAPAPNAQAANAAPTDPATAAAAPANPGAQVADVVGGEFGTYDKNKNGSLSKTEFGAWMTALRTKADPSLKDDAANKAWVAQAFTQADTDKSKSVSKDELTNFLSQGSGQKAS
ncbi:EF-hand domain-containing protein [Sphingomonas asaccharolytica]|uniref:EF-hand domain-containing protein n=1 Tax=Sphingomonas asaccharolytica TaxID=40681 RepID=UPI0009FD939A|nr:EF-hand domain-containing protein [Sphingomonas asaccharolytica]